jgi:hypothetical protein
MHYKCNYKCNFVRLAVRWFGLVPTESGCGSRHFSLNPDLDLLNPDRIQASLNPNRIQALLNPDRILALLNPDRIQAVSIPGLICIQINTKV